MACPLKKFYQEVTVLDINQKCRIGNSGFQSHSSEIGHHWHFTHIVWKLLKNVSFEIFIFGIFHHLFLLKLTCLVTLFDRNVEWDFFCDIHTTCLRNLLVFFLVTKCKAKISLWPFQKFNKRKRRSTSLLGKSDGKLHKKKGAGIMIGHFLGFLYPLLFAKGFSITYWS